VNGICGCGSPAPCCQPAVAGGVIYADLWGELSTYLAHRLCLLRVLLGATTTAISFPLSKHTGKGDTAPAFSGLLFIYSSRGKWVFPPLLWSFPPTTTFTSFSAPGCWAGALLLPSLASLFIYRSVRDCSSPPLQHSGRPTLFAMCLFCFYCLLFRFFFLFSLGLC
jgi:hypothetical protein